MRLKNLSLAVLCAISTALPYSLGLARTVTATPQVGEAPVRPVVVPYPAAELAPAAVAAALTRAKTSGKPVLLDFGGNWAPDCWALSGVLATPAVAAWVAQNYEVAVVNVSRFMTNMSIAAGYGVTVSVAPSVLIISPSGKLLNGDSVVALAHARQMTPQAVVDQLATWAKLD